MAAFAGKLNIFIGADTSAFEKKIKSISKDLKKLGKNAVDLGKDITMLTAPLLALGTTALGVGTKIEKAFRTIKIGTGASGAALKGLQDDFRAIATSGPQSFNESAKAIADLNTMTGATGETLQKLATTVLDASRMMETDLGGTISGLGKLLNNWNMNAGQGVSVMNKLFVASQATGLGLDAIAQGVTVAGGALRELGLGLDESIALVSGLDKAGINSQQALSSLSKALIALNKEGIKDTSEGLRIIIASIKEAATMGAAVDIGKDVFGARAGVDIAVAIREGKFEVEDLIKQIQNAKNDIADTSRETMTLGERFSTLGNQTAMIFEPLGRRLVEIAEEYLPKISEAFSGFSLKLSDTTIAITAAVVATGPLIVAFGSMIKAAVTLGGTIKLLATSMAGPVGLAAAIVYAGVKVGEYIEKSTAMRTEADDARTAVDDLQRGFANINTLNAQGQIIALSSKMVEMRQVFAQTTAALAKLNSDQSWMMNPSTREKGLQEQEKLMSVREEIAASIAADAEKLHELQTQSKAIRDAINSGGGNGPTGRIKGTSQSSGIAKKSGGGKSSPSALDLFVQDVQDRMRYLDESGAAYIAKIDEMQAKTKPLSDEWKKLQDLRINIDDSSFSASLQKIQDEIKYLDKNGGDFVPELEKMLEGLDPLSEKWKRVQDIIQNITESEYGEKWSVLAWEFSEGLLSATEYARLLEVEIAGLEQGTEKWRARFSELQNIKASELSTLLDSLSGQFENGVLSSAEYEAALAGIISEFRDFPKAAKLAQEALDAFQKQSELTSVSVGRQLSDALRQTTKDFNEMWGKGIEGAIDGFLNASIRGDDFGDTLRKLGEDIVFTTLKMIILNQMMSLFGGLGGGGGGSSAGADIGAWMFGFSGFGLAKGGAIDAGQLVPFAKGGVVHRPTVFPMASGAGLMGEAGPEAVMPLERDSHGRLGVVASGVGMEAPSVTVNVINESSQPVTATQTGPSFDEQMRQMVVGVILRDQATNGPITQNFRRR